MGNIYKNYLFGPFGHTLGLVPQWRCLQHTKHSWLWGWLCPSTLTAVYVSPLTELFLTPSRSHPLFSHVFTRVNPSSNSWSRTLIDLLWPRNGNLLSLVPNQQQQLCRFNCHGPEILWPELSASLVSLHRGGEPICHMNSSMHVVYFLFCDSPVPHFPCTDSHP